MSGEGMQKENEVLEIKLASWFGNELIPPILDWLDDERIPFSRSHIQRRADKAYALDDIDHHVRAYIHMNTDTIMRWAFAEGAAHHISAWIEPDGTVNRFGYGGHDDWIGQNADRLSKEVNEKGKAMVQSPEEATSAPQDVAERMMKAGWIRYSGGVVMTFPKPKPEQLVEIQAMIKELAVPPDYPINFYIMGLGLEGKTTAGQALSIGLDMAMDQAVNPSKGEAPLGKHPDKKADAGGGTSGPFQRGDGQEVQNSWQEFNSGGSTAPIDNSYKTLRQDYEPEVWWARDLLDKLKKNFPGKNDVSGPQSDSSSMSGTGPGQQFAKIMKRLIKHRADVIDPSDTDGQHDQMGTPMSSRMVNPDDILYKREKGRGKPFSDSGAGDGEARFNLV